MRPFRNRKYRTGSRFAFWRWSEPPNGFITRLHLIQTPWFAIHLHWFWKPDPEPYLHDHPATFLSLILWGSYWERRARTYDASTVNPVFMPVQRRRWWNYLRATKEDSHSVMACKPGTLSLAFMGPKRRDWGYHTPDGWEYWRDYNRRVYGTGGDAV